MTGSQKQTKKRSQFILHLSALGRNLHNFLFRSFNFSQETSIKYNKKSALALSH